MKLAVIQMQIEAQRKKNWEKAAHYLAAAQRRGCAVALLPELFEFPYFCKEEDPAFFALATTFEAHPGREHFCRLAKQLGMVLALSFFEKSGPVYFNSLALLDSDGTVLGVYRKTHLPTGPGYQEKFYFSPGAAECRVWKTRAGNIGAAICWDQWFPEVARSLALGGADVILYPTAIGSEPHFPHYDSRPHWQRVMCGHAAANLVPVAAANRIGVEKARSLAITFYGHSFITDATGAITTAFGSAEEGILEQLVAVEENRRQRANWGLFRDRRPELYKKLLTLDGGEATP